MSFDAVVSGVGVRLLSERNFDLILAPALADYQIERRQLGRERASRLAVMLALSGALRSEAAPHFLSFFLLALMPFCYDIVLLILFAEFFDMTSGLRFAGAMIVMLSMIPVVVCFWPTGRIARSID